MVVKLDRAVVVGPIARLELLPVDPPANGDQPKLIEAHLSADRFKGNANELSVRGLGPTLSFSTFNGREVRTRPCLLYQLKRCAGPCVAGLVSEAEYAQQVELAKLFLAGKNQQVIGELVGKMESASGDLRFEDAARYRDQIQALRRVLGNGLLTSEDEFHLRQRRLIQPAWTDR